MPTKKKNSKTGKESLPESHPDQFTLPQSAYNSLSETWENSVYEYLKSTKNLTSKQKQSIQELAHTFLPAVIEKSIHFDENLRPSNSGADTQGEERLRNLELQVKSKAEKVLEARRSVPKMIETKTHQELQWLQMPKKPVKKQKMELDCDPPKAFPYKPTVFTHFNSNLVKTIHLAKNTEDRISELYADVKDISTVIKQK